MRNPLAFVSEIRPAILLGLFCVVASSSLAIDNSTNTFNGAITNLGTSLTFPATTGTNNLLQIINGAQVSDTGGTIGSAAGANNNFAVVSGTNSAWYNAGSLLIGDSGAGNRLTISNGAIVTNSVFGYLGFTGASASNNVVEVTGSNSLWIVGGNFGIGRNSMGNQLIITNGGQVIGGFGGAVFMGLNAAASNNSVIVTGPGSVMSNVTSFTAGSAGINNQVIVSDSGRLYSSGFFIGSVSSYGNSVVLTNGGQVFSSAASYVSVGDGGVGTSNNLLVVTGTGSVFTAANNFHVGRFGANNRVIIQDGGLVVNPVGYVGSGSGGTTGSNSFILVTDPGSVWSNTSGLNMGNFSKENRVVVTNGGKLYTVGTSIGLAVISSNNSVLVTGPGSFWQNPGTLFVGSNTTTLGVGGSVLIENGATLESTALIGGFLGSGTISNRGGVYQFTGTSPTITPNTAGNFVLTNGTISFRNVAAADVFSDVSGTINQITYQGENKFRLNASSNTAAITQNYTFNTGSGATNFVGLELVNGTTLWRSKYVTIGATGSFLASNTIGTVAAVITNIGTIAVKNSTMTWASNVVISGSYVSDPSTNTFLADATVSQSGALAGGPGDLFDFKRSLFINSTNRIGFDLDKSAVRFSGGGMHTNAITGQDYGSNDLGYAVNFAYGELHLGSVTDQVCFTCGNIPTVSSNGLYVGWLDLLGSASLVTNLHAASGINLYYDNTDTRNAYLNGLSYQLTDCNFVTGGGFLMPVIPEPSTMLLFVLGACAMLSRRRSQ